MQANHVIIRRFAENERFEGHDAKVSPGMIAERNRAAQVENLVAIA